MKIRIINGPNLNLLGKREVQVYGTESFEDYFDSLKKEHKGLELDYFQSNIEGEIIDKIQEADGKFDGLVINSASYSHTSVGIADAIAAVTIPAVEVHISNVHAREGYRQHLITAGKCVGVITGLGLKGYELAIEYLKEYTS